MLVDLITDRHHPNFRPLIIHTLECVPYTEHILTGNKTIETRTYDIPKHLISQGDKSVRISILETARGSDGVSTIPDRVKLGTNMKRTGKKLDEDERLCLGHLPPLLLNLY